MLEARPKRWWSSTYLVSERGQPLTELSFAAIREAGGFLLGGVPYTLRRAGMRGSWLLEDPSGTVVASARKVSAFRKRIELAQDAGEREAIYAQMAQVYEEKLGKPDDAIAAYREVLSLDPTSQVALHALDGLVILGIAGFLHAAAIRRGRVS